MFASLCCRLALACLPLMLAACGGDDGSPSRPDTDPPSVLLATVDSSDGIVYLHATARDDVQVASVRFKIDGNNVGEDAVQDNDGTWLTELDASAIPAGTHILTAVASDSSGNSGEGTTRFVVAPPAAAVPDTTPPVAAAAVDGGFGLAKLTVIATDDVQVSSVLFYVDGQSTGSFATRSFMASDPADQYFTVLDTSGLADGPHRVFARVTDTSGNRTDSAEVVMAVDHAAGLAEAEPDDTLAGANVVAPGQAAVTGTIARVGGAVGLGDVDFYRLSVPANRTLVVDMLSAVYEGFFVQVVDADGQALTTDQLTTASNVETVTWANGGAARDVYLRVTSPYADFSGRDRYRLSLRFE